MTTSNYNQFIDSVIELLEKQGWGQNGFINRRHGQVCLAGAIQVADGTHRLEYVYEQWVMIPEHHDARETDKFKLSQRFRRELIIMLNLSSITRWNDTPGRTYQDVKTLLLRCKDAE